MRSQLKIQEDSKAYINTKTYLFFTGPSISFSCERQHSAGHEHGGFLPLTSLGHSLETDDAHFGFIRSSSDLLDDPVGLRNRINEDGYLYLKGYLDPDMVLETRRSILERLQADGLLDPTRELMEGIVDDAITRVSHVHARVDYDQGSQIDDPRDPFYSPRLNRSEELWKAIVQFARERGLRRFYFTPEFGPPPYARGRASDAGVISQVWEINLWMREFLKQKFHPPAMASMC